MPPPIKVYFIGTGGTTPFSLRNMPCIAMKYENYLIQYDFGEYCQYGLIKYGLHPFRSKTYILISHFHVDHVGGLPPFLHTYSLIESKEKITLVGPSGLRVFLDNILGIFGLEDLRRRINVVEVYVQRGVLEPIIDERYFTIYAFRTIHGVPALGYVFKEKPYTRLLKEKLKELHIPLGPIRRRLLRGEDIIVNGRLIRAQDVTKIVPGRKIVYTGDTTVFEELGEVIRDADLLIHEATYLKSEHEKYAEERYHSTVEDVCEMAVKSGVKRLALVHISPRYSKNMDKIREIAESIVGGKIEVLIPEDGDILIL